jgi:hypothetical protein
MKANNPNLMLLLECFITVEATIKNSEADLSSMVKNQKGEELIGMLLGVHGSLVIPLFNKKQTMTT